MNHTKSDDSNSGSGQSSPSSCTNSSSSSSCIVVGIVGYCDPKFDHALAKQYLITEFDKLKEESQRLNTQVSLGFGCFSVL